MKRTKLYKWVLINFVAVFVIFFNISGIHSQERFFSQGKFLPKQYLKSYFTDPWEIATSPTCWEEKDLYNFLFLSVLTASSLPFDTPINELVLRNRNLTTNHIERYIFEPFGSGIYSVPLLLILYTTSGKENLIARETALNGIKAFAIAGGVAYTGKRLIHRYRPDDYNPPDPWIFSGPSFSSNHTSFPSGHTLSAFAVASVIAGSYTDKEWVVITSYGIASLTGLSRIYSGEHWLSDVLASAILGTYIGNAIIKKDTDKNHKKRLVFNPGLKSASLILRLYSRSEDQGFFNANP